MSCQEKRFDGSGTPPDGRCGKAIPAGSRILKVALDYDSLASGGSSAEMAVGELLHRQGWYDPDVIAALQKALNVTKAHVIRAVKLDQLRDGMFLAANLKSMQGTLLCAKGTEVSPGAAAATAELCLQPGVSRVHQGLHAARPGW